VVAGHPDVGPRAAGERGPIRIAGQFHVGRVPPRPAIAWRAIANDRIYEAGEDIGGQVSLVDWLTGVREPFLCKLSMTVPSSAGHSGTRAPSKVRPHRIPQGWAISQPASAGVLGSARVFMPGRCRPARFRTEAGLPRQTPASGFWVFGFSFPSTLDPRLQPGTLAAVHVDITSPYPIVQEATGTRPDLRNFCARSWHD